MAAAAGRRDVDAWAIHRPRTYTMSSRTLYYYSPTIKKPCFDWYALPHFRVPMYHVGVKKKKACWAAGCSVPNNETTGMHVHGTFCLGFF
jgi:hypothetical protein